MKAVVTIAGLALAGLWVWALALPVEVSRRHLPERYAGTFEFFAFDSPEGSEIPSPLRPGQRQTFEFKTDGTYVWRAAALAGWELNRAEGTVRVDADGRLEIRQYSLNREPAVGEPARYDIAWERGEDGAETLVLTGVPEGQQLKLRRVEPDDAASSAR